MCRMVALQFLYTAFAVLCCLRLASAFELFIDKEFGVNVLRWAGEFFKDGPLYIVKDDRPYSPTVDNPLIQLITIQSTNRLELTWNTDPDEIVHYSWAFDSTNRTVLARPYLTVNHSGVVPRHQVFYYVLPCTGIDPTTLTGTVNLNYTITRNTTASTTTSTKLRGVNMTANTPWNSTDKPWNSTDKPWNSSDTPWNISFIVHVATRVNCELLAPSKLTLPVPTTVPKSDSGSKPLWVIGVVFAIVVIVVLLVFVLIKRKKYQEGKISVLERELTVLRDAQEGSSVRYMDVNSNYSGSIGGSMTYKDTLSMRMRNASKRVNKQSTELVTELRENWFEVLADCIIEMDQVKIEEQLGKGAFGYVYKGKVVSQADPGYEETVALKTMKSFDNVDDMSRFLSEGIVMKDFHHRNVMGLTGVCFPEEDPPIIVLPFMPNGDLHAFLKKRRGSVSSMDALSDVMISTSQLMQFILDVSHGMDYLSTQKFVHRDLAARNCMLDAELVVKIGDFGLAKEMHEDLYYRMGTPTKLPVKWMAIESLNDQIFTTQTDVWSFGVTMWEIWSMGKQPYPGVANHELTEHLMKGHRLQQPEGCTDELFEIMESCWKENSQNRPTFSQLVMMLERLESGRYTAQDEPEGYENFSPTWKVPKQNIFDGEVHNYDMVKPSYSPDSKRLSVRQPSKEVVEQSATLGSAYPDIKVSHAGEEKSGVEYSKMSLRKQSADVHVEEIRAGSSSPLLNNDAQDDVCNKEYMKMGLEPLQSCTLDCANGVTVLSDEERGAEYQQMTLNPRPSFRMDSSGRETTLSSASSQQQVQDDDEEKDKEYMKMGLNSSRSFEEEQRSPKMDGGTVFSDDENGGNYLKMALTPKQSKVPSEHAFSSVSSQQSGQYDDEEEDMEEYTKMGLKSSQSLEQQTGGDKDDLFSDEESKENYLKMALTPKRSKAPSEHAPSSVSSQQDEDIDWEYMKMSVKSGTSFQRANQEARTSSLSPSSDSTEDEEYLKMSLKVKENGSATDGYMNMIPKTAVAANGVAGSGGAGYTVVNLETGESDL